LFFIVNRPSITDLVLSDENGTDDKEKYRTDDATCANHSPWDVVTAYVIRTFLPRVYVSHIKGMICPSIFLLILKASSGSRVEVKPATS